MAELAPRALQLLGHGGMTHGQVGKGGPWSRGGGVEKGKRESESSFMHACCCHKKKRLCFVGEVVVLSDRFLYYSSSK